MSCLVKAVGVVAMLLVCACGGSTAETGSPPSASNATTDAGNAGNELDAGSSSTTGDNNEGSNVTVLTSLDDHCPWSPDATGRSIVDHLKSPYTATYSPVSGSPSALTITVSYADGGVRCHAPIVNTTGGAPDEPAFLEVIVTLGLKTADGTFADTFPANLRGPRGGYESLTIQAEVPTKSLTGTFTPLPMPGLETSLIVSGGLDFDGTTTGHVQQVGQNNTPTPPGTTNAGQTRAAGDWH